MKQSRSQATSTSSRKSGSQSASTRASRSSNSAKPRVAKPKKQLQKTHTDQQADPRGGASSAVDFRKQAKSGLHKRNPHQGRYDFTRLVEAEPALARFVIKNSHGDASINFSDPDAVKMLNKALLAAFYQVTQWDIPAGYLCPPIPGRADYIHRVAELLDAERKGGYPHHKVTALDIGVGANCIYPVVATRAYDWHYVGSDVDPKSVNSAQAIVDGNTCLNGKISLRLQSNSEHIFHGVISQTDRFDVTTCNPPFHRSLEEASKGTERKLTNLAKNKQKRGNDKAVLVNSSSPKKASSPLNFGGQNAELWCPGGEAAFVRRMAQESRDFAAQVLWFTTLISKGDNVRPLRKQLEELDVKAIRVVEMSQGQKVSRFVAWSFLDEAQRQAWIALK